MNKGIFIFSNIGYIDWEYVFKENDFSAVVEAAKPGGEWWLSPDEEEKIREQLFLEGRGGLAADVIIGQINQARFRQYAGIQSEPEMAIRDPISGAWMHSRRY